ncbi:MAG: hypothetical protein JRH20_00085 [Deltaproteobacteria bacterium]|nr:hypothetical protein [Deltaproteobacteria bacterium]
MVAPAWVHSFAWAKPRVGLSLELGPELDTNPARVTGDDLDQSYAGSRQTAAPLLRVVGHGELSLRLGKHLFTLGYGGGGKLYLSDVGRLADELVQLARAGWNARLSPSVAFGVVGRYYDAFLREPEDCNTPEIPCPPRRDFRSFDGGLELGVMALPGLRALARVGYSGLEFKPTAAFSFHSGFLGLELRGDTSTGLGDAIVDWSISASYRAAARRFGGLAQIPAPCGDAGSDECAIDSEEQRWDLSHRMRLEGGYLGAAELRLWYAVDINRSNSFGESFLRHGVGIRYTTVLVWDVYLTVTGVLQFSRFADPLYARLASQAFVDIEAENRSRLVLHLGRDLGAGWSVSLRHSLYVNESATTSEGRPLPGFLRQTLFCGLRYEYGT